MRQRTLDALRSIADALEIRSDREFTVSGNPGRLIDPAEESALGAPPSASPLIAGLLQAIYQGWYCRFDGPEPVEAGPGHDLLPALQAANAGRERWDVGWRIEAVQPDGRVTLRKADEARLAWPGEYVTQDGPGMPPRRDAGVLLRAPREGVDFQPGFYFAFGETLGAVDSSSPWVRFYWHLRPAGAAPLLAGLTRRLNRFEVPYRAKVLRHSSQYRRPDAGVLFVHRRHYQVTANLAAEVHGEIAAALRPGVPLFAKPLAPGLGVAEDPGNGESFGWQRCRAVAEGLWAAHSEGLSADERLPAIVRTLEHKGVDLAHPHLCRSRVDLYDIPAGLRRLEDAA